MKIKAKNLIAPVFLCFILAGVFLFAAGANGSTTVYVTNSGKKYHLAGCTSLSRSKIAITLADAVSSGYGPCGICKPPVLTGNSSPQTAPAPEKTPPPEKAPAREQAPAQEQAAGLYRVNVAGVKTSAGADIRQMALADVVDHVDGDTVRVRIANPPAGLQALETVRLLGVDTPETVHPRQPVQRMGKEASDYTKSRLLGKPVRLAFDWDLRDRYGRLLVYIYTLDQTGRAGAACFNAELIREGYAHAYTRFAFQFADEFRALEKSARQAGRGLWGE